MSAKPIACGGVVIDGRGRILLREPADHYGGYVWTFPKGRPQQGETREQTALRETEEETGVVAEIVAPIDRVFPGDTTENVYFLMRPTGLAHQPIDEETTTVCWAGDAGKARALIAANQGAHADAILGVLEAALVVADQHSSFLSVPAIVVDIRGHPPVPRGGGSITDRELAWRDRIKAGVEALPPSARTYASTAWFSVQLDLFVERSEERRALA